MLKQTLALMLMSSTVFADWALDSKASDVYVLHTKNSNITEISHFEGLDGKLDTKGNASLEIDLSSIESRIPIRNERMAKLLFEVASHPQAKIEVKVNENELDSLKNGSSMTTTVDAKVNLHGKSKSVKTEMQVIKDSSGNITAVSTQPLLINAVDFALEGGVDKLKEIAKLANISYSVPVTFKLVYRPTTM